MVKTFRVASKLLLEYPEKDFSTTYVVKLKNNISVSPNYWLVIAIPIPITAEFCLLA